MMNFSLTFGLAAEENDLLTFPRVKKKKLNFYILFVLGHLSLI